MNVNAFKVVDEKTRRGTNWAIYYNHLNSNLRIANPIDRKSAILALDDLVVLERKLQAYLPIYKVNIIIQMAPRTVGLMVFDTYEHARMFEYRLATSSCIIIDVEIIGKILPQREILGGCGSYLQKLEDLFSIDYLSEKLAPPSGTLFCKELLVLN